MISSSILLLLAAAFVSTGLGSQRKHRIVGGRDIDIEEAPWQVSLLVNGEHHCGGSLYSDRIIITAAQCFYFPNHLGGGPVHTKQFIILAGSELKRSRKYLAVLSAKMHHEKFNPAIIKHDIGIMKLRKPFPFSNQIQPIQLATEDPAQGSAVLSTGWAPINRGPGIPEIYPENLQGILLFMNNMDRCKYSPEHTLCVGQAECHGDSAAPLVFNNTLVGVFPGYFTAFCGAKFYTSVAHYHKWLMNAIKSISDEEVRSGNGKKKRAPKLS